MNQGWFGRSRPSHLSPLLPPSKCQVGYPRRGWVTLSGSPLPFSTRARVRTPTRTRMGRVPVGSPLGCFSTSTRSLTPSLFIPRSSRAVCPLGRFSPVSGFCNNDNNDNRDTFPRSPSFLGHAHVGDGARRPATRPATTVGKIWNRR